MMKNAASKPSSQSKQTLRFWVGVSCAGAMLLWWLTVIFLFQAHLWFTSEVAPAWPWIYENGSLITVLIVMIASCITVLCASWVFRGLRVKDATLAAVVLGMVPLFMFALFILIVDVVPELRDGSSRWMLPCFIASFLVPTGLYIWLFRRGPKMISRKGTILFAIFVPVFVIVLDVVYRIAMTGSF